MLLISFVVDVKCCVQLNYRFWHKLITLGRSLILKTFLCRETKTFLELCWVTIEAKPILYKI